MMRRLVATLFVLSAVLPGAASAAEVIDWVKPVDIAKVFGRGGLTKLSDNTADPAYPSLSGTRPDGFIIQATFFACEPAGCKGLSLTVAMPTRSNANAQKIAGSIERAPIGFDAWIPLERDTAVAIETYLILDGGVPPDLFSFTLNKLMDIIDQTKTFMLKDDPGVAEVWPPQAR